MSIEDADRLLKDLKSKAALKEKLKAAGGSGFEKAAKEAGYNVTRHEFSDAVKAMVVKMDLAGTRGFEVTDGIVQAIGSGVSSHVATVGSGIA